MKKLLYIVVGEISTGELSIALSFESNLDKEKYCSHFIVPDGKTAVMKKEKTFPTFTISREKSRSENREFLLNLIKEQQYDLILLFDVFIFEYAQGWTGLNMEELMELGIPIMSLDEYEYTKAGYQLDYYGMFRKKLPPLLEQCDYVIKNCPLTMTSGPETSLWQGEKKNEFYYRIFNLRERVSDKERQEIRKKYAKADGKSKIVFLTTSQWELQGAYSFAAQNRVMKWLGIMVFEYLKLLDEDITLLHVGSSVNNIPAKEGKVTYVYYDGLPVNEFEKVLQSVDLYVTFNLVSITLSKAIMFGIPSLVFNNAKIIDYMRLEKKVQEMPEWYQEMAKDVKKVYPFTASMFGWNYFLKTVLEDNPYVETFERVEFFSIRKTVEKLRCMLFEELLRDELREKNKRFISQYESLLSSNEILNAIFENK
ncbi:DUF6365 family protein [[Clostridium] polysaccharolyticum]|uniref:Uncharacterized protein n=1 Tax=[Clostridium] polysaccharolyticum TaxID=29364 RepID=A0A1H9ZT31_9FIRM|nr:DUF6365 family protein [[Clostridium] polysaccharolyticum]SES84934.1 hypothetical protein SAMN04487772_104111 [[Clostridium] polysaccharolyticum]